MKYFEDLELGVAQLSEQRHTLSKEEIIQFCQQWDPMPYHVDEEAAAGSYVGELFTSSVHTVAIGVKLAHSMQTEAIAVVAGIGWDKVRLHKPVCVGDVLQLRYYVSDKRESRSKPDRGIYTSTLELLNQRDEMVVSFELAAIILKRP